MEREIKFRAWVNRTKQMRIVHEVIMSRSGLEMCVTYGTNYPDGKAKYYPDALMQYTGLKDSTGKEIYEGDILESDFGYDGVVTMQGILYADNEATLSENVKIIGNIYEAPELIKTN